MTEKEIISEIIRYLSDTSYNYAVMIDGNWGCGKTYFVNHGLTDAIKEKEKDSRQPRKPLYISLYGCKSILDIQDSIAVKLPFVKNTLGRKVLKRIQQSRVVENSMQSAVVLAKAARDIYAPNISAFDIAVIWKDLKSYIFIFDDIERCSCPLNEVFGFINGLVEHDAVKAILVANEREIKLKEYDPNVGLSLSESDAYIKCYLGDTGLLVSHAFDENELLEDEVYKQILAGKLGINEGMLFENAVAQMLTANGHRLFFYTQYNEEKKRNDIEIDFIISNNSKTKYKIYPIEVKSGMRYTTESLHRFREKFKNRIGGSYIVHPRNLIEKDDVLCIPPYMVICL